MAENESQDPLERILKGSNREHLDNPFRSSDELRRKHFPGAGGKLSHSRLTKAYLAESKGSSPDWQLLAHGTWPWVVGHAHDLKSIIGELEGATADATEKPFDAGKRKQFVEQYSEAGTAEIETFLRIFSNGGDDFQKAILDKLRSESEPTPRAPAKTAQPSAPSPPTSQPESRTTVDDLDPITRSRMSLIGTLFLFVVSLIPLGIQFARQPDEDHWIVLGIAGIMGLLTIIFAIDYTRKRP